MEAGEGTTGRSKRPVRIDEVSNRFDRSLSADRALPATADGAGCGPAPVQDSKRERLAQLRALRERGIISEAAFRAQRRMQGDSPAPSPGPSKLATAPAPHKTRWRRRLLLGLVFLNIAGLGLVGLNVVKSLHRGAFVTAAMAGALTAEVGPNPENVHALGEAFRLGPYTYTVTGHQTATALDNHFSPVQAGQGNEYLIVTFSIRNDSTKSRVMSTDAFKLQDANGAVYAACSQGAAVPRTALTQGDLLLTEIQPGIMKVLAVAFEVPANSLKPPVKLLVFEQDLLGSREAIVYLQ
jgi:hypothetical protein